MFLQFKFLEKNSLHGRLPLCVRITARAIAYKG